MTDETARRPKGKWAPRKPLAPLGPGEVRLLSGGNPQIPKGDGDGPVQAWIAAVPGWKSPLAARIDRLIMVTAPGMDKAVRWNSPFWGMPGRGWTISLHGFTAFLRVTFLRGAHLVPLPPGPSKDPDTRYLDLRESDLLDEAQFADWVRQSAAMDGWTP
jgi:hypothetical protein